MYMHVHTLYTYSVCWCSLYFQVVSLRCSRDVKCTCDYICKKKVTVASLWQLKPLLWRCERIWGCVRGQSSAPTSRRNYAHSIRCPSLASTFCVGLVIVRRDGGIFIFATILRLNKHRQEHMQHQKRKLGDSFLSNTTSLVGLLPTTWLRLKDNVVHRGQLRTATIDGGDRWHISRNFRS